MLLKPQARPYSSPDWGVSAGGFLSRRNALRIGPRKPPIRQETMEHESTCISFPRRMDAQSYSHALPQSTQETTARRDKNSPRLDRGKVVLEWGQIPRTVLMMCTSDMALSGFWKRAWNRRALFRLLPFARRTLHLHPDARSPFKLGAKVSDLALG
jgi:hypothetical protein